MSDEWGLRGSGRMVSGECALKCMRRSVEEVRRIRETLRRVYEICCSPGAARWQWIRSAEAWGRR